MKKIKPVIVFSDLHIHNYKKFSEGTSRLDNTLKVLSYIYEYANNKDIDTILFSGDFYDQNKAIATNVLNKSIKHIRNLVAKYPSIKLLCISGNHDQSSQQLVDNKAVTILTTLEEISEGKIINIDNSFYDIGESIRIHGIPYHEHTEHFDTTLKRVNLKEDTNNILLMHQVPSGLSNNHIEVDVDINKFVNFDTVFNGHIHKHEKLSDNFVNVGSPIHRDADDEGQIKGFLLVDLLKPKEWRKIPILGFPEFVKVESGYNKNDIKEGDYIIELPPVVEDEDLEIKSEDFKPSLDASVILANYCDTTENNDKLEIGLSLLGLK